MSGDTSTQLVTSEVAEACTKTVLVSGSIQHTVIVEGGGTSPFVSKTVYEPKMAELDAKDADLQAQINALNNAGYATVEQMQAADGQLDARITQLAQTAEAADTQLDARITQLGQSTAAALSTEMQQRQAGDALLQQQIDTLTGGMGNYASKAYVDAQDAATLDAAKAYTDTAVATEATARTAADTQEQQDRTNADQALQDQITALNTNVATNYATKVELDAERDQRVAGDQANTLALNNEAAARAQGDADTLTAANNAANAAIAAAVDTATTNLRAEFEAADDAEELARVNADQALQDQINGLDTQYIKVSEKGAPDGVATLVNGTVPASQLPSFVDDVLEFDSQADFPVPGEKGKIYVVTEATDPDYNKQFRWTGTQYVAMVASPGTTDDVPEGSTNLYFTDARAQAAVAGQLANKADTAYVDAQDTATLNASKAYADTQDAATLAAAKTYADNGDATTLAAAKVYTDGESVLRTQADNDLQSQILANSTVNLSDIAGTTSLPLGIQTVTGLQQTWRNLFKGTLARIDSQDAVTLAAAKTYTDGQMATKANVSFMGYPASTANAENLILLANDPALDVNGDGVPDPVRVTIANIFNRLLQTNNIWTGTNTHSADITLKPTSGNDSPNLNFVNAAGQGFAVDTVSISGVQYFRVYNVANNAPLLYVNPTTGNVESPKGGFAGQSGIIYGRKAIDGVYSFIGNQWNRIIRVGATNQPWYIRGLLCIPNVHYLAEVVFSNTTGDGGVGAFLEYKTKGHYSYWGQYPSAVRVVAQATNGEQYLDIKFPVATSANTVQFRILEEYGSAARSYTVVQGASYAGANVARGLTFGSSGGLTYNEFRMHANMAAGSTAAALSTANAWSAPAQEAVGFGAT